mgnify:CR=1 FL=1
MLKFIKSTLIVLALVTVMLMPYFVFADSPMDRLQNVGGEGGFETSKSSTDLPTIVGDIISVFLGLLGIIFLVLIVYAGFRWMIAAGRDQMIDEAKTTLIRATVGLMIVVAAYAISQFVVYSIVG